MAEPVPAAAPADEQAEASLSSLGPLLDRLEKLLGDVEELDENLPGFVAMDVAPDDGAAPYAPPTQVLLQIMPRPT